MPLTRVTSNVIQDGTIIDADISASAAIAASKMGAGQLPAGVTTLATGSTTARSLANRFAEVINVKDFGAVGDGGTDDAPFIRAAFEYAKTFSNSTIFFPSGIYNLATYSDGTNTFPNQGVKTIVDANNNTSNHKNISIIGDQNVTIQSGLYPLWTGRYPDWGFLIWFAFGPKWSVNIEGIEFKRLIGGSFSPIRALPNNDTTSFGLTVAISIGYGNQVIKNVKVNITNCTFREFTQDIGVDLWQDSGNSYVGSVNIFNNSFSAEWGCNSASTDDILPSVNAHINAESDSFCNNFCVGGPSDFTPISNTQGGIYQRYKCKDGTILSGSVRSTIIGNNIKNYSVEAIMWVTNLGKRNFQDYLCNVIGNVLELQQPVLHNTWYPQGIVFHGPNGVVADNTINGAQIGIFKQAVSGNVIVKNNVIYMYDSINRTFSSTAGIALTCTEGPSKLISSLSRIGNIVTVVTTTPHFLGNGQRIRINGTSVSAYNKNFSTIKVVNSTTIQFNISGDPTSTSIGGNVTLLGRYIECSGNSIICNNANNDDNAFDGTPASWDYSWSMSSGIVIGGSDRVDEGKIENNYLKLNGKQNPSKKICAISNDVQCIIRNNISDGFDYFYGRVTGGNNAKYLKDNTFINGDRFDAMLVSAFTSETTLSSGDYTFAPSQSGWYEILGLSLIPTNVTLEILVQNNFDGKTFQPGDVPANKRFQYTKLTFIGGGIYNNGSGDNPNNMTLLQEHADNGAAFIPKIAVLNNAPNNGAKIFLWVPDVSIKPNKALLRSFSFTAWGETFGGLGGAASTPIFRGSDDASAGINSTFNQITLVNGVKQYARGSENAGFGGRLFGFGTPIIGTAAPTVTPNFFGEEFLDITNNKAYKAFGTTASTDWKILN